MPDTFDYDPIKYWGARKDPNRKGQIELHASSPIWGYLNRHIEPGMRLFELGPGRGRLFPLYRGQSLTTLDISQNYRDQITDAARENGISVDQHFSDDPLAPFPFKDGAFDLAIVCQVLIHVPFSDIQQTLSELVRIASKGVIISGHDIGWPTGPGDVMPDDHCFNHEYFATLTSLDCLIEDVKVVGPHKYFAFSRMTSG